MANTGFFHHIGSFLLFSASILILITCISAPVVHDISILKVDLGNTATTTQSKVNFGTFGYCVINRNGDDDCTPSELGYSPATILKEIAGARDFSDSAESATRKLSKALILNPIACGLLFIAFLLGAGAGILGSFMASLVAAVAFVVTLVILIIDFVMFAIVRDHINGDGTGATASYGSAAWTTLASAICSLLGTIIIFFSCCSARLHRRREVRKVGY